MRSDERDTSQLLIATSLPLSNFLSLRRKGIYRKHFTLEDGSNPSICASFYFMNTQTIPTESKLKEFLKESNAIENVRSIGAFKDAWKAWKFLICFDELSLSRILECHRIMMLEQNKRIAGKIRKVNVRVGFSVKLDFRKVPERLDSLLTKYPVTEEQIKEWHIEFENIHPFEDGNGRIGRIIMNWQRIKRDLPILIIHEGEEQFQYYEWFQSFKVNNVL
ncbi:MAG: Fic family protein [Methanogenium sp.]